jgi:energy-coupling factor transporter ATP-binding protein EcfA2
VTVPRGGLEGLFDREAELGAIEAAVARVVVGEGQVLVVRGPAGIGKSTLLHVAGRLAEDHAVTVLRARAAPFERGFPFGVVRQLFEPTLRRGEPALQDLFAGTANGARAVLGDEPGPEAVLEASFSSLHALYWLTVNLASYDPLLLCVDDLIWCDDPSLRSSSFSLDGLRRPP